MLVENKKIRGASQVTFDGITFKSKLELSCYKKLKESGLKFAYEPEKFILWNGFKPTFPIYAPKKLGNGKYGRLLELKSRSLLDITYTPDFIVYKDDYIIYFDVKGKENDTYPIKKKMFLYLLQNDSILDDGRKFMFFEPHSVYQMVEAINKIKTL